MDKENGRPNVGDPENDRTSSLMRAIRGWTKHYVTAWDTDPTLVQAMSRKDVFEELGRADRELHRLRQSIQYGPSPSPRSDDRDDLCPPDRPPTSRAHRLHPGRRTLGWAALLIGLLGLFFVNFWNGDLTTESPLPLNVVDASDARVMTLIGTQSPTRKRPSWPSSPPRTYGADVRAGLLNLQQARQTTLGLFPRYDPARVATGISALEHAYWNDRRFRDLADGSNEGPSSGDRSPAREMLPSVDASDKGALAFFIGKGYLMLNVPERAWDWFERSLDHPDSPWASEAKVLINRLRALDPPAL